MLKLKLKKVVSIVSIVTLLACLPGCGNSATNANVSVSVASAENSEESKTEIVASSETVEESKEESKVEESKAEETKEPFVADRSYVFELFSHMTVGWNLGNTFDAHGAGNRVSAETYWGNPKTTQEMIDAIAAQGFNTIRIPVTFAEHVGSAPDYKIDDAWLARVKEVVDYAYNADMYILLDTHHEPDYWMSAAPEKKDATKTELVAIWTQVANYFKDYDEKLIFEGMNENRVKGSADEWNGGTAAERKVIDELNQAFIDCVRATGGNNETRVLVISTYGNNAGYNTIKDFVIPEDNYIAVAIHMYTPYFFTYDAEGGYAEWDGSKKSDIASILKQVDKYFLQKDLPVIVTEFGAVNKKNSAEVVKWVNDYMGCMNKYGIKCVWWDNGNFSSSGEKFAIFNRRSLTWYVQDVADAIVNNAQKDVMVYGTK